MSTAKPFPGNMREEYYRIAKYLGYGARSNLESYLHHILDKFITISVSQSLHLLKGDIGSKHPTEL